MAKFTPNDKGGKRSRIQIYEGENIVEVTEAGELKVDLGSGSGQVIEGNRTKPTTDDPNVVSILGKLLSELKIMNIHLSSITDSEIKNTEIE